MPPRQPFPMSMPPSRQFRNHPLYSWGSSQPWAFFAVDAKTNMKSNPLRGLPWLLLALAKLSATPIPVTNWVTTNGDAEFSDGSELTNSPVTTDSDAETIVGSFPEVALAIGQSITLTGSVIITGRTGVIPGNQIRWGLFDAPSTPETGVGDNYVGVWATANNGPANIRSADGSTGNPFSGSATTVISTVTNAGGATRFDETLTFSLTITRFDDTQITTSGTLTNSVDFEVEWPETNSPASPASFVYDSVGFLLGGTTDATKATYTNVEVDYGVDETEPLAISSINTDTATGAITLTWTSTPGRVYSIDTSSDLVTWPINIDDSIPAEAEGTATSFVIPEALGNLGSRAFFRVSEVPQP